VSSPRPDRKAPGAPTPVERHEAARAKERRSRGSAGAVARATRRAEAQRLNREEVIYSSKWRTPLIVDIVLGSVVFVVGLVIAVDWSPIVGGGLGALGGLYAMLAARRWRLWAALRRDARPDT
jgi:hypothetical protein